MFNHLTIIKEFMLPISYQRVDSNIKISISTHFQNFIDATTNFVPPFLESQATSTWPYKLCHWFNFPPPRCSNPQGTSCGHRSRSCPQSLSLRKSPQSSSLRNWLLLLFMSWNALLLPSKTSQIHDCPLRPLIRRYLSCLPLVNWSEPLAANSIFCTLC